MCLLICYSPKQTHRYLLSLIRAWDQHLLCFAFLEMLLLPGPWKYGECRNQRHRNPCLWAKSVISSYTYRKGSLQMKASQICLRFFLSFPADACSFLCVAIEMRQGNFQEWKECKDQGKTKLIVLERKDLRRAFLPPLFLLERLNVPWAGPRKLPSNPKPAPDLNLSTYKKQRKVFIPKTYQ